MESRQGLISRTFEDVQPIDTFLAYRLWNQYRHLAGGFFKVADGTNLTVFINKVVQSYRILEFEFGFIRVDLQDDICLRIHGVFDPKKVAWPQSAERLTEGAVYLFETNRNVQRIECVVPSISRSLGRLLSRVGFEKEGTMRNWYRFSDGSIMDADMWSFIR